MEGEGRRSFLFSSSGMPFLFSSFGLYNPGGGLVEGTWRTKFRERKQKLLLGVSLVGVLVGVRNSKGDSPHDSLGVQLNDPISDVEFDAEQS